MMNVKDRAFVARARSAAYEVLNYNLRGPFQGLPRTAGWGYPEPYTRDLMISIPAVLVSGDKGLIAGYKRVLETLAENQSPLGHISSLVHDKEERGSSDTTPLFLWATALFRRAMKNDDFLSSAVEKALEWMRYQSPADRGIVAQLPTSDWRDELWVLGYGLYVNSIVYMYLNMLGYEDEAQKICEVIGRLAIKNKTSSLYNGENFLLGDKPYYACWSYKIYKSDRCDLLGNSLAIIGGLVSRTRSRDIVSWIEKECEKMREVGDLGIDLPPNFFPYIQPGDDDWRERYETYNMPGTYHNGGVWPFVSAFHIIALVKVGKQRLAERKLVALAHLVEGKRNADVEFGFNEWYSPHDGTAQGEDWQSWSAAMFAFAAECVERKKVVLI